MILNEIIASSYRYWMQITCFLEVWGTFQMLKNCFWVNFPKHFFYIRIPYFSKKWLKKKQRWLLNQGTSIYFKTREVSNQRTSIYSKKGEVCKDCSRIYYCTPQNKKNTAIRMKLYCTLIVDTNDTKDIF